MTDLQQILIGMDPGLGSICSPCGKKNKKGMKTDALTYAKPNNFFFFWSKLLLTFYSTTRATFEFFYSMDYQRNLILGTGIT